MSDAEMMFPILREADSSPPKVYDELRRLAPIRQVTLWDGSQAWLATRHQDVVAILSDNHFGVDPKAKGYPFISPAMKELLLGETETFVSMDPPLHSRYRKMLTRYFTLKAAETQRERVQAIADDLIDRMVAAGPVVDFLEAFAFPVPSLVITDLLGVPYEDHEFFQRCAHARLDMSGDARGPIEAGKEIERYLRGLVHAREASPGDGADLITRLVVEQVRPGHATLEEVIAIARLMLVAGHDSTASMIGMGALALMRNPTEFAKLIADRSLVPNAVEEMLRYTTIAQFHALRVAYEDVAVGDVTIRKGEGVIASILAANHDSDVFECPQAFNIDRQADKHLAFAWGIHHCIGQALARLELNVVFETLARRLPTLRLAVPERELTFKFGSRAFGLTALPVTW